MFKGLEWTNNEYKLSGTAEDSKSLKYKTFAIACSSTKDRVIALQDPSHQVDLPVIWHIWEVEWID